MDLRMIYLKSLDWNNTTKTRAVMGQWWHFFFSFSMTSRMHMDPQDNKAPLQQQQQIILW